MSTLNLNNLTEACNLCIRHNIEDIVKEESIKAQEAVDRRINDLLPHLTAQMFERIDYAIDTKQIIFTIKPNK